ncbi:hypothetical protein HYFRA_00002758 [Hymenoscyphus fraxineus]|uniref:Uncharacterized protein n=1 Tax=Hymenoscyphus fraxineus TaxID=746836 RepID=A0A9N9KR13_9HELO|nr:hypothetical protein HYFRA_00002758 [Hymenoscyphus fraxineus]
MHSENPPVLLDLDTSLPPNISRKETHQRAQTTPNSTITIPPRNSSLPKECSDLYTENNAHIQEAFLSFEPDTIPRSAVLSEAQGTSSAAVHQSGTRQIWGHQRSNTTLSPSRLKSTPLERCTKEEKIDSGFMATLTGDKDGVARPTNKPKGGLGSWFSGTSAPTGDIEIPSTDTMSTRSTSSEEVMPKPKRRQTTALELGKPPPPPKSEKSGLFGFFSPKTAEKPKDLPADIMNDEFLALDINAGLFPNGTADPFSPAAFNNLLMNAEGLLLKLQTAYKLRTLSLHEITAEKSALTEEIDEAGTRAQMLKCQLDEMAARVLEQDIAIAELSTELSREKAARKKEQESRAFLQTNARNSQQSIPEITEEDLGISDAASPSSARAKWRGSADLSAEGESDAESGGAESVFSRSLSPTFTMNSVSTRETTSDMQQDSLGKSLPPSPNPATARPKSANSQKSAFQKLMSGISSSVIEEDKEYEGVGMGVQGCSNCRGKDASVAWDTVGLLRAENKELKDQVGSMEDALDGALAVVNGYAH